MIRPGGKIIFSFLEFKIPNHWAVFDSNIKSLGTAHHLNQFMDRDFIYSLADHLELRVVDLFDGDTPSIPLTEPVTLESGTRYETLGALGQSIAVLEVP